MATMPFALHEWKLTELTEHMSSIWFPRVGTSHKSFKIRSRYGIENHGFGVPLCCEPPLCLHVHLKVDVVSNLDARAAKLGAGVLHRKRARIGWSSYQKRHQPSKHPGVL